MGRFESSAQRSPALNAARGVAIPRQDVCNTPSSPRLESNAHDSPTYAMNVPSTLLVGAVEHVPDDLFDIWFTLAC